jgi:hypothetical protein
MKAKSPSHLGVQDLCRRLKAQLDTLTETIVVDDGLSEKEKHRRQKLMEQLKRQLAELSI